MNKYVFVKTMTEELILIIVDPNYSKFKIKFLNNFNNRIIN